MTDAHELDDLEALLQSPGYQRLMAYAANEWGPAGKRFQDAVMKAAEKPDAEATAFLRCVVFAKAEFERFFRWPHERVSQLNASAQQVTGGPSRRGSL